MRRALGLNRDNFFLFGQSWGGMLAIEYVLAHQQHLKGLIISNMVSDVQGYNRYAREVLGPQMDSDVFYVYMQGHSEFGMTPNAMRPATARISFAAYNLRTEIDVFLDALEKARKMLT